jgi:hypothetical protein
VCVCVFYKAQRTFDAILRNNYHILLSTRESVVVRQVGRGMKRGNSTICYCDARITIRHAY